MKTKTHIVTGAPGLGKSTALQALLDLKADVIAFDIDWLVSSVGKLTGKSVPFDSSIWEPYNQLWFDVLDSIVRNHQTPILFAPLDRSDVESLKTVAQTSVVWLLLDCDDGERERRLRRRPDWTEARIRGACEDAEVLRDQIARRIDTAARTPVEVAQEILIWCHSSK